MVDSNIIDMVDDLNQMLNQIGINEKNSRYSDSSFPMRHYNVVLAAMISLTITTNLHRTP